MGPSNRTSDSAGPSQRGHVVGWTEGPCLRCTVMRTVKGDTPTVVPLTQLARLSPSGGGASAAKYRIKELSNCQPQACHSACS